MSVKSKWMMTGLSSLLAASLLVPSAEASKLDELKQRQEQAEQKQGELRSGISEKTSQISENQSVLEQIMAQIQELDGKIRETEQRVAIVEGEIVQTNSEIEELQQSIAELEKKIAEREELLKERARAIQKSGGPVEYIDVLLGANSFIDFIDRFSAVNTLIEADREIMRQQAEDKKLLGEQKTLVEKKLAEQELQRAELVGLKQSFDNQKSEKAGLVKQLETEQARLLKEKGALEVAHAESVEVSAELEQQVAAEQARLAEVARKQEEERLRRLAAEKAAAEKAAAEKAAAERAAAEQAAAERAEAERAAAAEKNSTPASSASSEPAPVEETATVTAKSKVASSSSSPSSGWVRPTTGYISSGAGGRDIGDGYETHIGLDIANNSGTPIVAARDGVVVHAGPMGTYGNMIMLTHSIGGQVYTTVYAHLSSIAVSPGQSVGAGQFIGGMGSTGRSTGPHLHFEVHVGPWNSARTNFVNPLNYVSF
nr:M23 family metallopeptidase [Planococcus lenghuensis]